MTKYQTITEIVDVYQMPDCDSIDVFQKQQVPEWVKEEIYDVFINDGRVSISISYNAKDAYPGCYLIKHGYGRVDVVSRREFESEYEPVRTRRK